MIMCLIRIKLGLFHTLRCIKTSALFWVFVPFGLKLCLSLFLQAIWRLSQAQPLSWVSGRSRGAQRSRAASAAWHGGAAERSLAAQPPSGASRGRAQQRRTPAASPSPHDARQPGHGWGEQPWDTAPAPNRFRPRALKSGREYLTTLVYSTLGRAKPQELGKMMAMMMTIMLMLMVRKIWSLTQVSVVPAVWMLCT